jgi:Divergent InlB B-repeat domain
LFNSKKTSKFVALTLLVSILLVGTFMIASAQGTATVTVLSALGGTTDPAAGATNTVNDGDSVVLTATALDGYAFQEWQILSEAGSVVATDNPYTYAAVGGNNYAIQPVFVVIQQVPGTPPAALNKATDALIGVLASAGGTTNPPAGLYYLTNAVSFNLQATANSGWTFSHWVISGPNLSHGGYPYTATPTENPYNVNHGYGNRYDYQAVFVPTGSTEPTPSGGPTAAPGPGGLSNEMWIIIVLVIVIVVILIGFGVFAMRKKH